MSLSLFYITHNIFKIADITFRIERVNGDLFFLGLCFIVWVGNPTIWGHTMQAAAVRSYNAKVDSKKRITLRNTIYEYFHIEEYEDGKIVLEPQELTKPFQISQNSLSMLDSSVDNFKTGNVSEPLNLSSYTDIE